LSGRTAGPWRSSRARAAAWSPRSDSQPVETINVTPRGGLGYTSLPERGTRPMKKWMAALCLIAPAALAQTCPEKNLLYWQAFPAGGESDISARHQQLVLKKKCPAIETIIQYKPGVGGAVMWNQLNSLPGDGLNVVGINLPHIVLAPFEGQV